MGRKRKNAMIADSRLTNCSVVVEILDEVFIPRHEPGFDYNWGNYSWHVATVKKDQGLPSEANEKILDSSITEDSNKVKQIYKNRKSCDQCNFKSTKPKFLMRHILTAHTVFGENEGGSVDENELVNDDDKSDTNTKTKHSNAKKLVLKKKASYKHRLGAKHSTPPKKLTRSNSLMEDRGNNENEDTISPGKKTKSDSVSMKTGKPVLNVHNSTNDVSKPLSDAPKAFKKEIISSGSPPKKIISDSPSITSKGLKSDLNADNFLLKNEIESSDGEQKKSFSCTKKRKSNSDPIKKKSIV